MKIGEIVTCIDENCGYIKVQGEIVEIRKTEDKHDIGIRLGPAYNHLVGYRLPGESDIIYFREDQLRQDKDWSCENKARKLFGQMWHHFYQPVEEFNPQKTCSYKGCEEKNTKRIMINIWGSVYKVDVCEEHEEFHGKCIDDFPAS